MTDIEDFAAYTHLADQLVERATKDQLADVARLLAINCGYYQARFGDVPQEVLLRMVRKETLDEETAALLVAGMQNLVSVLAEVTGLADDLQRRITSVLVLLMLPLAAWSAEVSGRVGASNSTRSGWPASTARSASSPGARGPGRPCQGTYSTAT
jgi:hypothetical protein